MAAENRVHSRIDDIQQGGGMRGWPAPQPRTLVGRSLNPQRNYIIGQSQSNKDRDLAIIVPSPLCPAE